MENWEEIYRSKVTTPQDAVSKVRSGQRVFIGSGAAEPQLLVQALAERGPELADTQITHILTLGVAPYADPKLEYGFRHNALFIGPNVREAVAEGRADFTPVFLSEVPRLFRRGKTIRERAMALIHIAHPDHREKLMEEARNRKLVYSDQVAIFGVGDLNRRSFERRFTTSSGKAVHMRPIRPTDEDMTRDLFYSCSADTLYHRFFAKIKSMPHHKLKNFVNIDYVNKMALASVVQEDEHEMIVAIGRYSLDKSTNAAEVAFIVRDDWQGQGLAIAMFNQLLEIARKRGIVKFTADVLHDNARMLHIFHKCAPTTIESTLESGVYHLSFSIRPGAKKPAK